VKGYEFLREALQEYEDAILYYELARPGLGDGFVREVEAALALTLEYPEIGTPVADTPPELKVRRQLIRRFGVEVDYMIESDTILVVALFHCKRRPGYWAQRLTR
jgi:plasmid stabilization system protein ParE